MGVKATTIKSGRKAAHPRKVVAKKESIRVQVAEKSVADVKADPVNLGTRVEGVDSEMKIIDEKAALMDLKGIEIRRYFQLLPSVR